MPTLLGYLGYDRPYVAFGKDLLATPADSTWAFNNFNIPQLIKGDYLLQFDGQQPTGFFRYRSDSLLHHNLVGSLPEEKAMTRQLKAILQATAERLKNNEMVVPTE